MIDKAVRPVLIIAGLLLSAGVSTAAADGVRVGFAAPLSGTFAPLGEQLSAGARLAANTNDVALTIADDRCDADGGKLAAENFVKANVQIAAGFLCSEALEAALPVLNAHNIPIIASGVSEKTLSEKRATTPFSIVRLTTGIDQETQATAAILASLWRTEPFAIIDDGTIEGRERATRVAALLKDQGLKPVFTDTYRPGLENQNALVLRLRRAGATKVYVGGERDDIAAIGASALALNYPLTIAGGSQLNAAPGSVPLAKGTLMIAPVSAQRLDSSKAVIEKLDKTDSVSVNYAVMGFASIEIAASAVKDALARGVPLMEVLHSKGFNTALGSISFDANGLRKDNPNHLHEFDGTSFTPVE